MIRGAGAVAKHSPRAVAAAWVRNGGRKAALPTALAVALCENETLDDDASTWCCHGVWQLHRDHTQISCARNLDCATKKAIQLSSNGRDWSAWSCHPASYSKEHGDPGAQTRFASKKQEADSFLDDFRQGIDPFGFFGIAPEGEGLLEPGGGGSDGPLIPNWVPNLEAIAQFFVGLGELLLTPDGWKRLAKVIGGAIILLWGLNVLMKQTTGTNPAATIAGGPAGAASNAVQSAAGK